MAIDKIKTSLDEIRTKIKEFLYGRDPEVVLTELRDKLVDVKFNIRSYKKNLDRRLKKYIKNGEMPPPPLLAAWKMASVMSKTIEGSLATIENALMMREVGTAITEATKEIKMENALKALNKIMNEVGGMKDVLGQLMNFQQSMVKNTQRMNNMFESKLDFLSDMTGDIADEAIDTIGAEFLAELQVTDPATFNSLSPQIRAKYQKQTLK